MLQKSFFHCDFLEVVRRFVDAEARDEDLVARLAALVQRMFLRESLAATTIHGLAPGSDSKLQCYHEANTPLSSGPYESVVALEQ